MEQTLIRLRESERSKIASALRLLERGGFSRPNHQEKCISFDIEQDPQWGAARFESRIIGFKLYLERIIDEKLFFSGIENRCIRAYFCIENFSALKRDTIVKSTRAPAVLHGMDKFDIDTVYIYGKTITRRKDAKERRRGRN